MAVAISQNVNSGNFIPCADMRKKVTQFTDSKQLKYQ